MEIKIVRIQKTNSIIDGQLFIEGKQICDCAENSIEALPLGTYRIKVMKCKQFGRKMPLLNQQTPCGCCPLLENVGNNTPLPCNCPMLKPGNGAYAPLHGSIIVGHYLTPGCLTHPKTVFDALYNRIRKNAQRKREILLTITDTDHLSLTELGTMALAKLAKKPRKA